MNLKEIIARCEHLFEDLQFSAVKEWKAAVPGRKAIGYMPIYVPRELVHAAGMLPVGIFGGGDQLEVIQGDAYYQSYICRIPRSTLELGLTGRLDCLDGMLFPVDLRRDPQPFGHVAGAVQGQVRQVLRPAAELRRFDRRQLLHARNGSAAQGPGGAGRRRNFRCQAERLHRRVQREPQGGARAVRLPRAEALAGADLGDVPGLEGRVCIAPRGTHEFL